MNFEAAYDGVCNAIAVTKVEPGERARSKIFYALHALCMQQMFYDTNGGSFADESMEELECTFENDIDYEWWISWPNQPAAASKPQSPAGGV